ncbi:hypothetical protein K0M31_015992 [Melipona bicolor]|uniref:Uncharacterized protein n=1 Tax=Melipona bicolor TaxID=60889 RepID=A0AA40G650_9HYME|nr:hypothetical protein K0M31_015992 [Melipona bicolor]
MTDPEYAFNFRRQVYIDPDDIEKIPSTLLIIFENIFSEFSPPLSLFCFLCKQDVAKDCLQNPNTLIDLTNSNINSLINAILLPAKKIPIITETNIANHKLTIDKLPTKQLPKSSSTKRPLSQTSADDKPDYASLNNIDFIHLPKKIAPTKSKQTRFQSPAFDHAKLEKILPPTKGK